MKLEENQITNALLSLMVQIDQNVFEEEVAQMLLSMKNLGLELPAVKWCQEESGKPETLSAALEQSRVWPKDKKVALLKEMVRIAIADGNFLEKEQNLVVLCATTWEIPIEEMKEIITIAIIS
jgi:uncharacterized tellurite resistance protein B-like protein